MDRATRRGYTQEDFQIIFNDKVRVIEELPYDDTTPAISKQDWIELCKADWGDLDVEATKQRIRCHEYCLFINVCGSVDAGYGAILRGAGKSPIVARSRSLPNGVSEFHARLHAVLLGAEIAVAYHVWDLKICVPSFYVYNYIKSIWNPYYAPNPNMGAIEDLDGLLHPEDRVEETYILTRKIIETLEQLRHKGIRYFRVQPVLSPDNKAAEYLAKLNVDRSMKFAEICEDETLCGILHLDACC